MRMVQQQGFANQPYASIPLCHCELAHSLKGEHVLEDHEHFMVTLMVFIETDQCPFEKYNPNNKSQYFENGCDGDHRRLVHMRRQGKGKGLAAASAVVNLTIAMYRFTGGTAMHGHGTDRRNVAPPCASCIDYIMIVSVLHP
jgi:hypothetical protein